MTRMRWQIVPTHRRRRKLSDREPQLPDLVMGRFQAEHFLKLKLIRILIPLMIIVATTGEEITDRRDRPYYFPLKVGATSLPVQSLPRNCYVLSKFRKNTAKNTTKAGNSTAFSKTKRNN